MVDKLSASEAVYGFVGWLTGGPRAVTMSAKHDAALPCELVAQFCEQNELADPKEGWKTGLVYPSVDDDETVVMEDPPIDRLKLQMQEDSDYAHSWHCNVAMAIYDSFIDDKMNEGMLHRLSNKAASRFMKSAFGVETSGGMLAKGPSDPDIGGGPEEVTLDDVAPM